MNFADRLFQAIEKTSSIAVVGLDPRLDFMPPALREQHAEAKNGNPEAVAALFLDFNKQVIDAVAGHVAAVKPQVAFYEQYGWPGYKTYLDTIAYARSKGVLVIGDVKRGDISSTATAYAQGHLSTPDSADAVTVNPYMGADSVKPFLEAGASNGRGCFILVKTSNASSADFQDLDCDGRPLYEQVAEMVHVWGEDYPGQRGYSAVGAVVGATFPEEVKILRALMPKTVLLIPGYGAQGGSAEAVRFGTDANGMGAIVNSSRSILYSWKGKLQTGEDWRDYVQHALSDMNKELNEIRG